MQAALRLNLQLPDALSFIGSQFPMPEHLGIMPYTVLKLRKGADQSWQLGSTLKATESQDGTKQG